VRALLTILLLLGVAWAEVPRCPGDVAPGDAQALSPKARRVHRQLAAAVRGRATMAFSASTQSLCVTSNRSFLGPDWLNAQTLGPVGTHMAFGLMAYAVGVQRFLLVPAGGNGQTADQRGAWHVGCAYARASLNRARTQFMAENLHAYIGSASDASAWMAIVDAGFHRCGGN
jgi:hypothetical protein